MAYVSGRLFAGQRTGLGITPTPLVTNIGSVDTTPGIREVLVQSDPANTTNVLVGNSAAQYMQLTPGQSISIPVHGINLIYVAMVSGTGVINWLARD